MAPASTQASAFVKLYEALMAAYHVYRLGLLPKGWETMIIIIRTLIRFKVYSLIKGFWSL